MSYSQYRQRNESGKSVASDMAFPSSFKKEHTFTSEDEEQITQEGSFTGHSTNRSNPSTWQAFSSIKRTSRMGRLKTAPLPTRLATIEFDDEDDVDVGPSKSNTEKENVPQISQSTSGDINHHIEPRSYSAADIELAATIAPSMQVQSDHRIASTLTQQPRGPLSSIRNDSYTQSELQVTNYSRHLGKGSPVKYHARRDIGHTSQKQIALHSRSPDKKYPAPVRFSPNKHSFGLRRLNRQPFPHQHSQHVESKNIPTPSIQRLSIPSNAEYRSNHSSFYTETPKDQSSLCRAVSNDALKNSTNKPSAQLKVPETISHESKNSRSIELSSTSIKDRTKEHTSYSTSEISKGNQSTEGSNVKTSRMQNHTVWQISGNNYTIINQIGKGGSSLVYRALDDKDQMRAIKKVDLSQIDEQQAEDFKKEISHLERLKGHERIIELFGWEQKICDDGKFLYLVMECGEKDLGILLKELCTTNNSLLKQTKGKEESKRRVLTDTKIKFYWEEMLEAVQVIHSEGIVHRDLKPGNFVIVGGRIKLIDFGIASAVADDKTHVTELNMIGTFNFMSPEAIQSEKRVSGETVVKLNYKTDVWSLGCILYNMVYNRMPFGDIKNPCNKIMAIVDKNHKIQFSDTEISGHDPVVNEVLKLCLERNPSERGSIEDLLEHKYLKQQHTSRSNLASQSRLQRTRTPESAQPKQKSVEQMLKEYSTFSPGTKEAFFKRIQNK